MSESLSMPPADVLEKLQDHDPEIVFAIEAAVQKHSREMELWEAHFEHLQAIQKTIAKLPKAFK